jgi:hypothetical protein
MAISRPIFTKSNVVLGVLSVVVAIMVVCYTLRPGTAPPGKFPAVPPVDAAGVAALMEGTLVPALSDSDHEKLKQGQTVEIRIGDGILKIEASEPGDGK